MKALPYGDKYGLQLMLRSSFANLARAAAETSSYDGRPDRSGYLSDFQKQPGDEFWKWHREKGASLLGIHGNSEITAATTT